VEQELPFLIQGEK